MKEPLNNRVAVVRAVHEDAGRQTAHLSEPAKTWFLRYMEHVSTLLEKIKDLEKRLKRMNGHHQAALDRAAELEDERLAELEGIDDGTA